MHQHPDYVWFRKMTRPVLNQHQLLHQREARELLRREREAVIHNRRFILRYRLRSLLFRLVPGLAKHWAL